MGEVGVAIFEVLLMIFFGLLRFVLFLARRFDVTNSLLAAILCQMLTCNIPMASSWRWGLSIAVIALSMLLQHRFKAGRIAYAIFSCVVITFLASVWKTYDTQLTKYVVMAICFAVAVFLNGMWYVNSNEDNKAAVAAD